MAGNTVPFYLHDGDVVMADPGNAGTIAVNRSPCALQLVSAAAETRTLARPTAIGAILTMHFLTDGGDITLTVTGGYNEDGDTTFTFSDPGQFLMLQAFYDGTNYFWRKIADYLTGNVTPTELALISGVTAGTGLASKAITLDANGDTTMPDLGSIGFGGVFKASWDTTDANANKALMQLPTGASVDVPVIVIGQGIEAVDMAIHDGITEPTVCVIGVGAVTTGPRFELRKSRGTAASPTVVTSADDLGQIDAYACVAAAEWVRSAQILFECTGTVATTRGPGVITFKTATDAAPSVLTTALTISAAQLVTCAAGLTVTTGAATLGGTAYIGDTANANVTLGLTINQAAADDGILALKSSDVAHGMTTIAETDTYGHFLKLVGAEGGLRIIGLSDTGAQALDLQGYSAIADTTDAPSTTSLAACNITGGIANTTGVQTVGAAGNLLNVRDSTNATTFVNAFVVKGDGELYSNQSATVGTFDDYQDALMCKDLSYVLSKEYGKVIAHSKDLFKSLGIVTDNPDGTPGMYSLTKMNMLMLCAIGQLGDRLASLTKELTETKAKLLPG